MGAPVIDVMPNLSWIAVRDSRVSASGISDDRLNFKFGEGLNNAFKINGFRY